MPTLPITNAYRDRYMQQQGQPDAPYGQPMGQPTYRQPAGVGQPTAMPSQASANVPAWAGGPQMRSALPPGLDRPGAQIRPMPPGFVPPPGARTSRMPGPLPTNDGTARMPEMNDQLAGRAAVHPYLQRIMALRGSMG